LGKARRSASAAALPDSQAEPRARVGQEGLEQRGIIKANEVDLLEAWDLRGKPAHRATSDCVLTASRPSGGNDGSSGERTLAQAAI